MTTRPLPVIVLDRDGVINFDSPDYIKSADEWTPIPGSIEAIAALSKGGYQVFVATNQAGLAKGKFSQLALDQMHAKLQELVIAKGGEISGIHYCHHHPDDNCQCRKPAPGMLLDIAVAAKCSNANLVFVGDSLKDIEAAVNAGAKPVLVLTGNGEKTSRTLVASGKLVDTYANLAEFAVEALNIVKKQ